MACTIRAGLPLYSLVLLTSAITPLAVIIIGIVTCRDPVSLLRVGMLSLACLLVGGAMMV